MLFCHCNTQSAYKPTISQAALFHIIWGSTLVKELWLNSFITNLIRSQPYNILRTVVNAFLWWINKIHITYFLIWFTFTWAKIFIFKYAINRINIHIKIFSNLQCCCFRIKYCSATLKEICLLQLKIERNHIFYNLLYFPLHNNFII